MTEEYGADRVGTLIHAADLHLGAPLLSLGERVGTEVAEQIRSQSDRAFDRLISLTIEQEADILVLAGDIYDQAESETRVQLRFAKAMQDLTVAGVKVFIAHGNHDPVLTAFQPAARLPSEVVVFGVGEPDIHSVTLRSGAEVNVVGISFRSQSETENLASRFASLGCDSRRTVGVLHANVGSNSTHDNYAPCSHEDLEIAPIGYWALGHIHKRQVEPLGPKRWWAYPGNLQGRSTKAAECGPKGALVVPILRDGFGEPEFHPCHQVRFERIDFDVSEAGNFQDVCQVVNEGLLAMEVEAGDRSLLVRARLIGSTDAHHQLRGEDNLLDLIRQNIAASVTVSKVEVATRARISREQLISRDDLLSDVLKIIDMQTDPKDFIQEMVGDQLKTKPMARLKELLGKDPELSSEIMFEVEAILENQLVEE